MEDGQKKAEIYSINSRPHGRPWALWAELWWKWCYSGSNENLASNISRNFFSDQWYEKVWFLAGTFGGKANRKCRLPKGRSVFFPIINDLISLATDPHLKDESELRAYAKADLDEVRIPPTHVNIDGFEILHIERYRFQTAIFDIVLPPRAPNSNQAGSWFPSLHSMRTRAVSDGYWIFLKPLHSGKHRIEFIGEKLQYDKRVKKGVEQNIRVPKFRVDVTYQIEVT